MSGYVPDFIHVNAEVIVDGKPEIVKDYYFTSGPDGRHNSDTLILELRGRGDVAFDHERVLPPSKDKPDFIKKGARVILDNKADDFFNGEWEIDTYEFRDEEGYKEPRLHLMLKTPGINSFIPCYFDKDIIKPAPPPAEVPRKPRGPKKEHGPGALTRDLPVRKPFNFGKKL